MNLKLQAIISVVLVTLSMMFYFFYPTKPELSPEQQTAIDQQAVQDAQLAQQKQALEEQKRKDDKARIEQQARQEAEAHNIEKKQEAAIASAKAASCIQPNDSEEYKQLLRKIGARDCVEQARPPAPTQSQAERVSPPEPVTLQQVVQLPTAPPATPQPVVKAPKVASPPKSQGQGVNAVYKRQDVVPGQKTGGVNDTYGAKQVQQGMDSMDAWAAKNNLNQGH